jgi:hypothetical protein
VVVVVERAKKKAAEHLLRLDDEKARLALKRADVVDLVEIYTTDQDQVKQRLMKPKPK